MTGFLGRHRRALIITVLLVLVSPVFGVVLAEMVGYHEPLDVAAEKLGLPDKTSELNWTPFLDYTVPGLPETLGYIVAGLLGIAVILGLGALLHRLAARRGREG